MEKKSIATRSLARTFLMICFHLIVYIFTVKTVRDTQCGFKLFTRGAASKVNSHCVLCLFFLNFTKYIFFIYYISQFQIYIFNSNIYRSFSKIRAGSGP